MITLTRTQPSMQPLDRTSHRMLPKASSWQRVVVGMMMAVGGFASMAPVSAQTSSTPTSDTAPAPSPAMKALFDRVSTLTQKSYGQLQAVQQDSERRFGEVAIWFSLPALATPAGNARAMTNIDAIRTDFTRRQALQDKLMKDLEQLYATAPGLTSAERSELQHAHADAVAQLRARQSQMDSANLSYNGTMKSVAEFVDGERRAGRLSAGAGGRPAFAPGAQPRFDALVAQLTQEETRVNQLDASIRQDGANARAGATSPQTTAPR